MSLNKTYIDRKVIVKTPSVAILGVHGGVNTDHYKEIIEGMLNEATGYFLSTKFTIESQTVEAFTFGEAVVALITMVVAMERPMVE